MCATAPGSFHLIRVEASYASPSLVSPCSHTLLPWENSFYKPRGLLGIPPKFSNADQDTQALALDLGLQFGFVSISLSWIPEHVRASGDSSEKWGHSAYFPR